MSRYIAKDGVEKPHYDNKVTDFDAPVVIGTGGHPKGILTRRRRNQMKYCDDYFTDGGELPLNVMMANMRKAFKEANAAEKKITKAAIRGIEDEDEKYNALKAKIQHELGLRQVAHQYARDAAPYLHPKLSAINIKGPTLSAAAIADAANGADAKVIEGIAQPNALALELQAWNDELAKARQRRAEQSQPKPGTPGTGGLMAAAPLPKKE